MQNLPSNVNDKAKQDAMILGHERSQDSDGPFNSTNYTSNISQVRSNLSPTKLNRAVFSDNSGSRCNNVLSHLDEAESNMEQEDPTSQQIMYDMTMQKQKGNPIAAGNGF